MLTEIMNVRKSIRMPPFSEPPRLTSDFVYIKRFEDDIPALKGKMASEWVYDRPIVRLSEDDTARDAMDALYREQCSCALVYDRSMCLLGVLDLMDLVRAVLRGDNMPPVRSLLRACTVASHKLSLNEVCHHLKSGARYVGIAPKAEEKTHQIVSQRAVAQALHEISTTDAPLRHALAQKIEEKMTRGVVTCSKDSTAKRAFQIMAMYGISSLPLCGVDEMAVGVISATDILYSRDDFARLEMCVSDYVRGSRSESKVARDPIVSCSASDTLYTALDIMLEKQVHHVYILDTDRRPIGVVSFVDILRRV